MISSQLHMILDRLDKPKKQGDKYMAKCPSHADSSPSLSLTEKGNKILVHCFAGCSAVSIMDSIGLSVKDLFLDNQNPKDKAEYKIKQLSAEVLTLETTVNFYNQDIRNHLSYDKKKYHKAIGDLLDKKNHIKNLKSKYNL